MIDEDELRNILVNTGKNFWGRKLTLEQKDYLEQKYYGYTLSIQCKLFLDDEKRPECPICGGALKLLRNETCSHECSKILEKQTGKIYEKQEKIKQTNLRKYGVENPQQRKEIKTKTINTNIEKYGCSNPQQNQNIREKTKNTNLEKYGVEFVFQSPEIRDKIKQTNIEKYGVENIALLPNHYEKCKDTLIKNYGVDHYSKSDIFKEKRYTENIKKIQSNLPENIKILQISDPDLELFDSFENPNKRIKFCCYTHNIEEIVPVETFKFRYREYSTCCSQCANIFPSSSAKEKDILNYLKSFYSGEIIENDRKIIHPQELDIVLTEKNIAIEFCGLFWHNENRVGKYYHYNKMKKCCEKGYKLITIFEDEWDYKKEIVKNILKAKLINKNIENYIIKKISNDDAKKFNKKYNINGHKYSSLNYGIFYNDILISVMSFNNENKNYELTNYSSVYNYDNNFKKLFDYFVKVNDPEKVYISVDNRWDIIENSDFNIDSEIDINYWYVNKNKRIDTIIEKNKKYNVIWDCGSKIYVWTKKERE